MLSTLERYFISRLDLCDEMNQELMDVSFSFINRGFWIFKQQFFVCEIRRNMRKLSISSVVFNFEWDSNDSK